MAIGLSCIEALNQLYVNVLVHFIVKQGAVVES